MKVLECSSVGDKRFSAFFAKVSFYGKIDSIENIYQSVKYDREGNRVRKSDKVYWVIINGRKLEPKYLTPFYKLLWVKYLDRHPELVEYAKGFDEFNDRFRGKCINCQADVIRDYVKYGRDYIMQSYEVREFLAILKS